MRLKAGQGTSAVDLNGPSPTFQAYYTSGEHDGTNLALAAALC